jgi:hypothetical protein
MSTQTFRKILLLSPTSGYVFALMTLVNETTHGKTAALPFTFMAI